MKTPTKKIGYKGSINGVCLNDQLNVKIEVGKTYECGRIELYNNGGFKRGFQFNKKIKDVLFHFEPSPTFVLFEIEILSKNVKTLNGVSITDQIKVIREIPLSEHKLFELENTTYTWICHMGFRVWETYDLRGNCIHFKTDGDYEEWFEYDLNDNCIHTKDSNGYESWFDSNRNVIRTIRKK